MMKMNIRTATLQDIDQIAAVEKECFPAAEAANKRGICAAAFTLCRSFLADVRR